MQGYANVNMEGNLVRDITVRYFPSGTPCASFTVAVNRVVKSEFKEHKIVDFIDCQKIGEGAEELPNSFTKGAAVKVSGHLVQQRWETNDGQKKSRLVVEAVMVERTG